MRLRKIWEDIESSLWFRPSLWLVAFGMIAILLIAADRRYIFQRTDLGIPWFLVGGAEGARTMLGAIASAMLTVTSLAFSLMMVTVVQTANAYSPRIIRQYIGDEQNQNVLGILIGTFLYSLLVLRSVRGGEDAEFVPVLATNGALVLSLLSTAALIYFINHVAQSIKVSSIIQLILEYSEGVVDVAFPRDVGEPWPNDEPPQLPEEDPIVIEAKETGYIQLFDHKGLLDLAVERGLLIQVLHHIGDFVLKGNPLVSLWPNDELDDEVQAAIREAFIFGPERTFTQDLRFGIRQLADIAMRALSPGINDPTTAINAINSLSVLLATVIERGRVSPYRCGEDGELHVVFPELSFAIQIEEAFIQILHYGSTDFAVVSRLIDTFGQLGYIVQNEDDRHTLWQITLTAVEEAAEDIVAPTERRKINESLQRTAKVLDRNAEPYTLTVYDDERSAAAL